MEIDMIISYKEMVASVGQMIHDVCEEEGIDYDHFVTALNDAFNACFEIVEM